MYEPPEGGFAVTIEIPFEKRQSPNAHAPVTPRSALAV